MVFRFIHMADVHLDTPFQSRDDELRSMLKKSLKQALLNAVDTALSKEVDAVLIAGDLFDSDTLSFQTEKFIMEQALRLNDAGINVFYAPGNHDHTGCIPKLHNICLPPNVHVFGSMVPTTMDVYGKNGNRVGTVAGMGHGSSREGRNLAALFPKANSDVPHVALLHTFVAGSKSAGSHDRYAPSSLYDMNSKGYAYWALGHIHEREELQGHPYIVYPGNLMGRNPGETGLKGVYLVEINHMEDTRVEFIPLSPVCWQTITIDGLKSADSSTSLENIIRDKTMEAIRESNVYGRLLLRIVLKGRCGMYREIHTAEYLEELSESIRDSLADKYAAPTDVAYVEILADGVTRPIDPGEYRGQPHMLATALDIIDRLKGDDRLLLSLAPGDIAGFKGGGEEEKIRYLKSLLQGMDQDAVSAVVKEGTL